MARRSPARLYWACREYKVRRGRESPCDPRVFRWRGPRAHERARGDPSDLARPPPPSTPFARDGERVPSGCALSAGTSASLRPLPRAISTLRCVRDDLGFARLLDRPSPRQVSPRSPRAQCPRGRASRSPRGAFAWRATRRAGCLGVKRVTSSTAMCARAATGAPQLGIPRAEMRRERTGTRPAGWWRRMVRGEGGLQEGGGGVCTGGRTEGKAVSGRRPGARPETTRRLFDAVPSATRRGNDRVAASRCFHLGRAVRSGTFAACGMRARSRQEKLETSRASPEMRDRSLLPLRPSARSDTFAATYSSVPRLGELGHWRERGGRGGAGVGGFFKKRQGAAYGCVLAAHLGDPNLKADRWPKWKASRFPSRNAHPRFAFLQPSFCVCFGPAKAPHEDPLGAEATWRSSAVP